MHARSAEEMLERVERRIRDAFPAGCLEIARRDFPRHIEVWVYVLDLNSYVRVKTESERIVREEHLDEADPEIWLLVKSWTGPWPGGESEEELRRRREEFRKKHNLPARP